MSSHIKIQAAIYCGGKHDMPVYLTVPLSDEIKRSEFALYAEAYALGRRWSRARLRKMSTLEPYAYRWAGFMEQEPNLGASSNDWRCPECSKARPS